MHNLVKVLNIDLFYYYACIALTRFFVELLIESINGKFEIPAQHLPLPIVESVTRHVKK